ncbi:flagellar hook-associated protein FlgL [Kineococcus sp. NUM-3379]
MIGRVSSRTTAMSSLQNLQQSSARHNKLQEQLTSGKAISKPSDNPIAASNALRYRTEIGANEQYARNNANGQALLDTQEESLKSGLGLLQRVRDLTVQAASTGGSSPAARKAAAIEVRSLQASMLGAANATHLGRPVFAGTADSSTAFTANSDGTFTYNGNAGEVTRRVGPDLDVQVNVLGTEAFGGGTTAATSTFVALEELAAKLEGTNPGAIAASLADMDVAIGRVTAALTTVGARGNQLSALADANEVRGDALNHALDEVEGIDFGKAMIEYNLQQTAYQAALSATAKVIQPTLLDFLR